jgi:hypothetical protein
MIETRTIRPCFAVICCYASMGRQVRWRGALLAEGWRWGVSVEVAQRGFVRLKQPHFGEQAMRHKQMFAFGR